MASRPLAVVIPIANGSEPEILELDDLTEVYGDWPEVDTPCENPDAPGGQCHFNAVGLEPDRCLYCGKITG
jgi:hypothetical protein